MAEARITEIFGETQIREEVLDFMGLGSCMPREAWRLPSPQMLQYRARPDLAKMRRCALLPSTATTDFGFPWYGTARWRISK